MNIGSRTPATDFSLDVFGRYVCNTYDEALANSDPAFRSTATDLNGNHYQRAVIYVRSITSL